MSRTNLALRYAAFAAIATLANLGLQRVVLGMGEGRMTYILALVAGTAIGLVVKYLLDKRWIFFDDSSGVRAHGQKFALYSAMGIVTTAIFWGTETGFLLLWGTDLARELGAVIGLTIGYVTKYELDRRYVFTGPVEGRA